MTRSLGTIGVKVQGDVRDLAVEFERDLNGALKGVKLNFRPIEKQFGKLADVGEKTFEELAKEASEAATDIGVDMGRAGEKAEDALREVGDRGEREMDRLEREAKDAGSSMLRNLSLAAVGVSAAFAAISVGRFFLDAAQAAEDLGSAIENTEQIIKSTGAAAGLTAQQVRDLSKSLSLKIGVDSVEVQDAANVLLTFKGVSGDTFKQAIALAADLSAVLGTDLKGSTLQLGKALQDPVRGITALRRAGVDFTKAQQKQIKNFVETNQLAKAQALILAEVRSQVGGVAEAGVDATDQLKVAWLDLKRVAGAGLIEGIENSAPQLIEIIGKLEPVLATVGDALAAGLEAALPLLDTFVTTLADNAEAIGPAMQPIADVFSALLSIIPQVLPSLVEVTRDVLPDLADIIGDVAAEVGPLIGLVVRLAAQFVRALAPALDKAGDALVEVARVAGGALMDALPELAAAGLKLLDALLPLVPLAADLLHAVLPLAPPIVALAAAIASVSIEAIAAPLAALTGLLADNEGAVLAVVAAIVAMTVASKANAIATAVMTAAMKAQAAVSSGVSKGMSGVASAASNASLGLAAAGVALLAWGEQARHTSDDIVGLTEDVKRFVETGATTATMKKHFGEGADAIAEFDDKLDLASAGFFNWADHLNRTYDEISKGKSAFADLDTALAKLVDGGADAEVVFQRLVTTYNLSQEQIDQLRRVLPQYGEAAARAKDRTDDLGDAQRDSSKGALAHAKSLKELGDALRAQTDPVFAFVRAQKAARDAQREATNAAKEFGRNSPQYRDAALDVAEAQISLADATTEVKDATDASLLPALKQMRAQGLLSEDAFRELSGAIASSKRAADRLDGTQVRVSLKVAIDAAFKRIADLLRGFIPVFHDGGIVPGSPGSETLAILKAGETVLPPGMQPRELVMLPPGDRRAVDLLAKAMEQANAGLRAVGVPGAEATAQAPSFTVVVEIDGQQLHGRIVRVVNERDRTLRRKVRAGAGARL